MKIDDLTIGELKQILQFAPVVTQNNNQHPMIGRKVLCRTYSAGVHTGTLVSVNGMEAHLKDGFRIWSWDGALACSTLANKGTTGGKTEKTEEVYLTNVIEIHPTTAEAEKSYAKFTK